MADPQINWPRGVASGLSNGGEVHVWAVPLNPAPGIIAELAKLLSPDELDRAQAYKFPGLRDRYTVARGQLRRLLGAYLQLDPARVEFDYSPRGKPSLKGGVVWPSPPSTPLSRIALRSEGGGLEGGEGDKIGAGNLHFNLAHSDELALIAVTRGAPVGVDVEKIRPMPDAEGIAERFFSARELQALRRVAEGGRDAAFFNLWSRKEAWLKATGDGIAESLSKIEVAFLPDEPSGVLAIDGDVPAAEAWSLCPLNPAGGYVGALAIRRRPVRLQCWCAQP